eukprot:528435_1
MASQVKVLHMRSSSFEHAYSHTIHPVEESNEAVQPYDDASQIDLEKEDTIFDPGGQDHYDEGDGTNIQTKPGYSLTICAREIVSDKGEKIVYIGDDIENERKNVVTWCDIERNDELSYGAERLRGEEVTFGVFYPNEIKIETVKVVREENKYDATTKQSDEDDEPELLSYVNASKYHQIKANNVVTVRKSILRELGKFMFGCSGDIVSLLPSGIMVILSKVPFQIQMPSRETDNNMLVVLSQIISDMASYRVEDMDVSMTRSLLAIPRTNRSCLLRKECILTGIAVLMNSHTYANRAQLIGNDGELEIVSEMTHLHYPQHVAHLALRMITAMCGASVAYYLVKQSKLCRVLIRHDIMIEYGDVMNEIIQKLSFDKKANAHLDECGMAKYNMRKHHDIWTLGVQLFTLLQLQQSPLREYQDEVITYPTRNAPVNEDDMVEKRLESSLHVNEELTVFKGEILMGKTDKKATDRDKKKVYEIPNESGIKRFELYHRGYVDVHLAYKMDITDKINPLIYYDPCDTNDMKLRDISSVNEVDEEWDYRNEDAARKVGIDKELEQSKPSMHDLDDIADAQLLAESFSEIREVMRTEWTLAQVMEHC